MRRRDWEELVGRQQEVTPDEWRQLGALANTTRAPMNVSEEVRARVVAVTSVQYVDRQEAWQVAWIVGPENRVIAPAATAHRRRMQARITCTILVFEILVLAGVIVAVASARGALG
ncbi:MULTISPECIES: hypothetical protein [unclassified Nocardioides]|uniref:hypothetical protein n=1 Tax=unclassified Nocardioides TaxID=2615069 RepID=UPI000713066A|nr:MULTISPECIES: hypothetical protein [unclassified Nocardioides]KRA91899.1 hypothetical protein ASD84_04710 [Nocardioides sp. Root682]